MGKDFCDGMLILGCMNIITYLMFLKLINYRKSSIRKKVIISTISIIEAFVGIGITKKTNLLISMVIIYLIHSIVINKATGKHLKYSIIITFISLTITCLIYLISIVLSALVLKTIIPNIAMNNVLIFILGIVIEYGIIYVTFKTKRLKQGVSFLKNEDAVINIGIIGFAFVGITIVIYALFSQRKFNTYLFTGVIIESICLTIWLRRKITKYYKQKMKEKTIEELEAEIKEKDKQIEKILEENKTLAEINHKYTSRISALEKVSTKLLTKPEVVKKMNYEFGEEFTNMTETIKKLSEEYSKEISTKIKAKNNLPKTGVFGIDNILEYMRDEAEKSDIKFTLKINGNIHYMVENVITESKLETLLGDHIKDAIIAINHSNNSYKSILTVIGVINDCYEVNIYDTGVEFEIDTLIKLGKEAITTHSKTGGSGIGFMTTFETLKEIKASLIIEEKHPISKTDYTKVVRIRFDNKNEYKIISYRAEQIKKQNKEKRIIVNKLKK